MLDAIAKITDPYERRAQLFPALLLLAPVFVVLVCRFGQRVTFGSGIVSILVACGALFWLARIARNAGAALQEKMWQPWSGTSTIRYLRHRESPLDPITRERYHKVLAAGIDKTFPTAAEEEADSVAADHLYRSGIKWLMEQTRDPKKYAHLLKENIAYGFHRNMLGLKSVAIGLSLGCLAAALSWTELVTFTPPYVHINRFAVLSFEQIVAILLPAATLLLWIFFVTKESVEQASTAYTERLLQACEGLAAAPKKKPAKVKEAQHAA